MGAGTRKAPPAPTLGPCPQCKRHRRDHPALRYCPVCRRVDLTLQCR